MKKIFNSLFLFLTVLSASAQDDNAVIMRINGNPVEKGEFVYQFKKNISDADGEGSTVEQYLPMFVNYKLKVAAAYEAKYDTLSSYRKEYRMYRDQLLRSLLAQPSDIETEIREYYDKVLVKEIGEKGLLHVAHIVLTLKQSASTAEVEEVKTRIDSIHKALLAGSDFSEMARKFSMDGSARRGGELGIIAPGQTVEEFETAAYALADGEISAPVQTPFGWHIIKTIEHKPLDSYEELHDRIQRYLEQQGMAEKIATRKVTEMQSARNITMDELMDEICDSICMNDLDTRYLVNEYREGLLYFEICDREIWKPAQADTLSQMKYFKKNKKHYKKNFKAKNYSDVKQQVAQDYQRFCEEKFAESLRKKYIVEVFDDVVKSVK